MLSTRKSRTISSLKPSSPGCSAPGRGGPASLAFAWSLRFLFLAATHTALRLGSTPHFPEQARYQRISSFLSAAAFWPRLPARHFSRHLYSFLQARPPAASCKALFPGVRALHRFVWVSSRQLGFNSAQHSLVLLIKKSSWRIVSRLAPRPSQPFTGEMLGGKADAGRDRPALLPVRTSATVSALFPPEAARKCRTPKRLPEQRHRA